VPALRNCHPPHFNCRAQQPLLPSLPALDWSESAAAGLVRVIFPDRVFSKGSLFSFKGKFVVQTHVASCSMIFRMSAYWI